MFGPKELAGWRTLGLLTWGEVEWDWERPQGLVKSTQAPVGPLSEASWAGQQCTDCVAGTNLVARKFRGGGDKLSIGAGDSRLQSPSRQPAGAPSS